MPFKWMGTKIRMERTESFQVKVSKACKAPDWKTHLETLSFETLRYTSEPKRAAPRAVLTVHGTMKGKDVMISTRIYFAIESDSREVETVVPL